MNNYDNELQAAQSIAIMAGEIMRKYFYGGQNRTLKSDGSPVTIADTKINSMVIEELGKVFPNDGVIGEEESNSDYGMGRKWFCDPVDGTKAYTWGVPTAMFSLALVIDGVPVVGVGYEPMLDRMYHAVKGGGAYCNDQEISVNQSSLSDGIVAVPSSPFRIRRQAAYFDALLDKKIEMAVYSGAVAKSTAVSDGRFVAYIEELGNAHDYAAVHVIVEEAGGKITTLNGRQHDYSKPFNGAVVSNGLVHDELIAMTCKD